MLTRPDITQYNGDATYIRQLRLTAGKTQVEWAALMGRTERGVRNMETGHTRYDYAVQYLAESLMRTYKSPG